MIPCSVLTDCQLQLEAAPDAHMALTILLHT